MIVDVFEGDLLLLQTMHSHIAFAINKEGIICDKLTNDICKYAMGFTVTGEKRLGEVVSIPTGNVWYHGIVCYSTKEGWSKSSQAILTGLNKIEVKEYEYISVILMGLDARANLRENIEAIHLSKNKCLVFIFDKESCSKEDVIEKIKGFGL